MWDPKLIDLIAQAVVARIVPLLLKMANIAEPPRLLTTAQAAKYLGRSVKSVQKLREREQIPYVKRGRRIHYDREALDCWIRQYSA